MNELWVWDSIDWNNQWINNFGFKLLYINHRKTKDQIVDIYYNIFNLIQMILIYEYVNNDS